MPILTEGYSDPARDAYIAFFGIFFALFIFTLVLYVYQFWDTKKSDVVALIHTAMKNLEDMGKKIDGRLLNMELAMRRTT